MDSDDDGRIPARIEQAGTGLGSRQDEKQGCVPSCTRKGRVDCRYSKIGLTILWTIFCYVSWKFGLDGQRSGITVSLGGPRRVGTEIWAAPRSVDTPLDLPRGGRGSHGGQGLTIASCGTVVAVEMWRPAVTLPQRDAAMKAGTPRTDH